MTANGKLLSAPDMSGRSIMVVAPQTIEASLTARRLQLWGAQTCTVSDIAVARSVPERTWHAVLIDRAFGADAVEHNHSARPHGPHATQRIVMFTPATRHELPLCCVHGGFTGYLVKPLRAASLAARLTALVDIASAGGHRR